MKTMMKMSQMNKFTIMMFVGIRAQKSYIGHWALSKDIEWTEEGQIVIGGSNLKSHE